MTSNDLLLFKYNATLPGECKFPKGRIVGPVNDTGPKTEEHTT
jgi:hypothetical protein